MCSLCIGTIIERQQFQLCIDVILIAHHLIGISKLTKTVTVIPKFI